MASADPIRDKAATFEEDMQIIRSIGSETLRISTLASYGEMTLMTES